MKGFILLVIVVAGAARAQQPVPCLKVSKVAIPDHGLRQQESSVVKLTFKTQRCAVAGLRDRTAFKFESVDGLDISLLDLNFKLSNATLATGGIPPAQELSLALKLSASAVLPVGEHTIRGLLTYQVIDASGNPAPESLAISFPLKVIPHRPYKKMLTPDNGAPHEESGFVHGLKITGEVVAGIPIFIALAVECLFTGKCWEC